MLQKLRSVISFTPITLKKTFPQVSSVSIMSGCGVNPIQGTRTPVKVVIQSVTVKAPGVYQDYATFTIATTE